MPIRAKRPMFGQRPNERKDRGSEEDREREERQPPDSLKLFAGGKRWVVEGLEGGKKALAKRSYECREHEESDSRLDVSVGGSPPSTQALLQSLVTRLVCRVGQSAA